LTACRRLSTTIGIIRLPKHRCTQGLVQCTTFVRMSTAEARSKTRICNLAYFSGQVWISERLKIFLCRIGYPIDPSGIVSLFGMSAVNMLVRCDVARCNFCSASAQFGFLANSLSLAHHSPGCCPPSFLSCTTDMLQQNCDKGCRFARKTLLLPRVIAPSLFVVGEALVLVARK
jgi:hypothetical protein